MDTPELQGQGMQCFARFIVKYPIVNGMPLEKSNEIRRLIELLRSGSQTKPGMHLASALPKSNPPQPHQPRILILDTVIRSN